jgi:ketol-acid reductoisomerase
MTTIVHEPDADIAELAGRRIAVVGYGNQGRPWALNLRDADLDVQVCVQADASRERARTDGFEVDAVDAASSADVLCLLVPDDAIPHLQVTPQPDALVIVASGYTLAFDRFDPACDVAMVAPRMLGPEVRRCFEEGVGFITAFGVHRDATGQARPRALAVAKAIGGLKQGAIELTPTQEAILDLAVEQALSPALRCINQAFVQVMVENGIPLEAIMAELVLSGEVERNYRLLREQGYAAQMDHHSPISQYGQMSRADRFDHGDVAATMRDIVAGIADGTFAQEWDDERDAGGATFERLKRQFAGPEIAAFERDLRGRLGVGATSGDDSAGT